jgi:magnesium transporter
LLGKLLAPTIEELIRERDFLTLKNELSSLPAADLGDLLSDLESAELSVVFRLLNKDKATDVFEYLDVEHQQALLQFLSKDEVKHILEDMSVDDRTALLDELPPQVASQLIELLSHQDRTIAQTILNYPEESAGRLITPDYVSLGKEMTVAEALDRIRRFGKDKETVYSCYVIGQNRRLLGVVSLRKLVTSPLDARINDLLDGNFPFLHSDTPQEEAVEIFRRYDALAMPVLDRDGNMVGIVTFDDIMDIAEEEFREDMENFAAVVPGSTKDFLDERIFSVVARRAPWLIALLVVQAVAVMILSGFDALLNSVIALAFFVPALTATGGNTGTQSAAMVIRAIATGEVTIQDLRRIILQALLSGFLLAATLAVGGFLLAIAIVHDWHIGLCVGAGLGTVVLLSNMAGSVLPLLLKRFGLDPALMSGPFISTIVDVMGLIIYLQLSKHLLTWFAGPGGL